MMLDDASRHVYGVSKRHEQYEYNPNNHLGIYIYIYIHINHIHIDTHAYTHLQEGSLTNMASPVHLQFVCRLPPPES